MVLDRPGVGYQGPRHAPTVRHHTSLGAVGQGPGRVIGRCTPSTSPHQSKSGGQGSHGFQMVVLMAHHCARLGSRGKTPQMSLGITKNP